MSEESLPMRTDDGCILVFWEDVKQYGAAHDPKFATCLMVRVSVPGDNKATVERECETVYAEGAPHTVHGKVHRNEATYARFGKYIEEYKTRQGGPKQIKGTPIDQVAFVNRAMVANLKHNGIYSAEDLAGLTDAGMANIGMGGRALVQKAKDFLAARKDTAAATAAMERERKAEERFAALEEKFKGLADALAELPPDVQEKVKQRISKSKAA